VVNAPGNDQVSRAGVFLSDKYKYWYRADKASEGFSFLHAGLITAFIHEIFREFM